MAKKKPRSSDTGFTLPGPDDLNNPPANLSDYRILIYGPKAVGKTSLASRFDGAVVAMLEKFRRGLKIRMVPNDSMPGFKWTWSELEDFRDAALADDTVQTLVFDTIDLMYELCLQHECRSRGIKHPGEMKDYGATWAAIKTAFADFFDPITESGKGMVCLSHVRSDKIEPRSGEPYDQMFPSCAKGAFAIVQETFDLVLYYGFHGRERAISVRSLEEQANTEVFTACGPEDVFLDPNGEPLCLFTVPSTVQGAYDALLSAFHNEVWDAVRGQPRKKKKGEDADA